MIKDRTPCILLLAICAVGRVLLSELALVNTTEASGTMQRQGL